MKGLFSRRGATPSAGPGSEGAQRSLFGEILDWMLVPLLLLWPLSVGLTWIVAQSIASRPYDRELADVAQALGRQVVAAAGDPGVPQRAGSLPAVGLPERWAAGASASRTLQVIGSDGSLQAGSVELPQPDASLGGPEVGVVQFRDDFLGDLPIRVAALWVRLPGAPDGAEPALVQVAETLDERSQLAAEILKGVLVPQYAILPLAVLMVWLALSRGLAPLEALQQRIRLRRSSDLSPIDESDTPEEVAPLVRAINDLLSRLDQSVANQKHFLADAAHQLKTPLAGLRMQAELAEREIDAGGDTQAARSSLQQIARATQNATRMVNQLLTMARAEDSEQALRAQPVDLDDIAADVVQDFVPKALDKRIDLGYEPPAAPPPGRPPLKVLGNPVLLRELLRNLVDNALQYTPAGGSVTVRLLHDVYGRVAVVQVEDTGVGIPEAERELVFQPFYRALGTNVDGSGLGLAIVREIVQQHGGTISITDARERTPLSAAVGTRFTVRLLAERREGADAAATLSAASPSGGSR